MQAQQEKIIPLSSAEEKVEFPSQIEVEILQQTLSDLLPRLIQKPMEHTSALHNMLVNMDAAGLLSAALLTRNTNTFCTQFENIKISQILPSTLHFYHDLYEELSCWLDPDKQQIVLDICIFHYLEYLVHWSPAVIAVKKALIERIALYPEVYAHLEKRCRPGKKEVDKLMHTGALLCNWFFLHAAHPELTAAFLARFDVTLEQISLHGSAALSLAITYQYTSVITQLLQNKARFHLDIEKRNKENFTPLQQAIKYTENTNREVVLSLLEGGAKPTSGCWPAIKYHNLEVLDLLLQNPDVYIEDKLKCNATLLLFAVLEAESALEKEETQNIAAAAQIRLTQVRMLLERGADPHVKNDTGKSFATSLRVLQAMGTSMEALSLDYHLYHAQKIHPDMPDLAPSMVMYSNYVKHIKKQSKKLFLSQPNGLNENVIAWVENKKAECERDLSKIIAIISVVYKKHPDLGFCVDTTMEVNEPAHVEEAEEEKSPCTPHDRIRLFLEHHFNEERKKIDAHPDRAPHVSSLYDGCLPHIQKYDSVLVSWVESKKEACKQDPFNTVALIAAVKKRYPAFTFDLKPYCVISQLDRSFKEEREKINTPTPPSHLLYKKYLAHIAKLNKEVLAWVKSKEEACQEDTYNTLAVIAAVKARYPKLQFDIAKTEASLHSAADNPATFFQQERAPIFAGNKRMRGINF